ADGQRTERVIGEQLACTSLYGRGPVHHFHLLVALDHSHPYPDQVATRVRSQFFLRRLRIWGSNCLHSPRTPARLVPVEQRLRRVCLAAFRLRFALDPGPIPGSYYGSRAVALSTNLGGPIAQYPIVNAVPFLLQSRLHAND